MVKLIKFKCLLFKRYYYENGKTRHNLGIMLANHKSDKGIIYSICNEFSKLESKKSPILEDLDVLLEKASGWLIST